MYKNKVIVLRNNNVNTLGIIRNFGENGIKTIIFIISDTKFIAVRKSKYVENAIFVKMNKKLLKE